MTQPLIRTTTFHLELKCWGRILVLPITPASFRGLGTFNFELTNEYRYVLDHLFIDRTIMRRISVFAFQSLLFSFLISCLGFSFVFSYEVTPEDYLAEGDDYLSKGSYAEAINSYKTGIDRLAEDESLLTILSLETNLATALSLMSLNHEAIQHYQKAIATYMAEIDHIADRETAQYANDIAASSAFFLGMEYQDDGQAEKAVESYGYAVVLNPNHWSALANLGSVLHDNLSNHDEALNAYNKAYEILTSKDIVPSDPPPEPRLILSQLQYRIGLCLNHNPNRKCALSDDPDKEVSCQEMAAHAFSLAVEYDSENESAKHMLATVTADATMKRASNTYVKTLFDDYAQK